MKRIETANEIINIVDIATERIKSYSEDPQDHAIVACCVLRRLIMPGYYVRVLNGKGRALDIVEYLMETADAGIPDYISQG